MNIRQVYMSEHLRFPRQRDAAGISYKRTTRQQSILLSQKLRTFFWIATPAAGGLLAMTLIEFVIASER